MGEEPRVRQGRKVLLVLRVPLVQPVRMVQLVQPARLVLPGRPRGWWPGRRSDRAAGSPGSAGSAGIAWWYRVRPDRPVPLAA